MNEEQLIPYIAIGCCLLIALAWTFVYLNEREMKKEKENEK